MTDNDNEKIPHYRIDPEKLEEYLKKLDEDIEWFEEFSKKMKEKKESGN